MGGCATASKSLKGRGGDRADEPRTPLLPSWEKVGFREAKGRMRGPLWKPLCHSGIHCRNPARLIAISGFAEAAPLIRPPLRSGHLLPQGEKGVFGSSAPAPLPSLERGVHGLSALSHPSPLEGLRGGGAATHRSSGAMGAEEGMGVRGALSHPPKPSSHHPRPITPRCVCANADPYFSPYPRLRSNPACARKISPTCHTSSTPSSHPATPKASGRT